MAATRRSDWQGIKDKNDRPKILWTWSLSLYASGRDHGARSDTESSLVGETFRVTRIFAESKAQEHFRQLAFLSGKLDRTIVLPNVHSSHLGACRKYPFSFYYDDDWLLQNQEHFSFITVEDFNKWITERNQVETPTSQEVYVEISENLHFLDKAKNCYEGILDYTGWPRKRFYLDDPEDFSRREGNYTEILLNALSDEARKREYIGDGEAPPLDVISLLYDRRWVMKPSHAMWQAANPFARFTYIENPEAYTPLSYSKRWTKIADAIAEQLSPFVAIHWRMERLEPVTNMVPCAQSLVNKVKDIESRSEKPLRLFLLTDYPHLLNTSKAVPESMSFKPSELKQDHHDAIKYVYTNLDVYLTILKRENQPIPYEELPADHWNLIPVTSPVRPPDMSVLGIIDKLVAMRAEYFLAGKPAVCGKQSSFTKRIMEERLQAYSAGNPTIRLPMDYFAL